MCAEKTEYKDTLNLPRTEFPMRAGLPKREPQWLARWAEMGVYENCLLYTSPSPRDLSTSRMPSSA